MPQPTAAMLVIGDEILSGRTRDANANHLAIQLNERGVDLTEIRVVPDDADRIAGAVREMAARVDHLFTSGGIGPTHDDITADCVAAAFGAAIDVRDDAREILERHYGDDLNAARLRMARIPDGATLIDNPLSKAPGFTLKNVHVMAGVPEIFRIMLEGLLPKITGGQRLASRAFRLEIPEGDLAEPLREIAEAHPGIRIGCYPSFKGSGPSATVVLRSEDQTALDLAAEDARARLAELGPEVEETTA